MSPVKQMVVAAKVVVVALVARRMDEKSVVEVALPATSDVAYALVEVALAITPLVAPSAVAKSDVVVALVVVELSAVKFWSVVEAKVMRPPQNCDAAVVEVAVM
jgi:hypothetical protein